ncbi:hypothetical protein [Burkholderia glumae]
MPKPFLGADARNAASAYFSADDAPVDPAVELVRGARRRVLVAGYGAVPPALAAALRDACRRGVAVRVVLDRSARHGRYSGAAFLAQAGIGLASTRRPGLLRQPFVIADDAVAVGAPAELAGAGGTADAAGAGGAVSVFHGVPQLAQTYTHAFWRVYRLAGAVERLPRRRRRRLTRHRAVPPRLGRTGRRRFRPRGACRPRCRRQPALMPLRGGIWRACRAGRTLAAGPAACRRRPGVRGAGGGARDSLAQ